MRVDRYTEEGLGGFRARRDRFNFGSKTVQVGGNRAAHLGKLDALIVEFVAQMGGKIAAMAAL